MTDIDLHRYANSVGGMALKDGFDEKGYILKALSDISLRLSGESVDLVSESQIDETIQSLINDFVLYFNSKDTGALSNFLVKIRNILSELYHSAESTEERKIITDAIKTISIIK